MSEKSWHVELSRSSLKSLKKLPEPASARILNRLEEIGKLENPLRHKDVRSLEGELKGFSDFVSGSTASSLNWIGPTGASVFWRLLPEVMDTERIIRSARNIPHPARRAGGRKGSPRALTALGPGRDLIAFIILFGGSKDAPVATATRPFQ
jgi:hypothetical protein